MIHFKKTDGRTFHLKFVSAEYVEGAKGNVCFYLPSTDTRNAPQSFLSLELFAMNIFWALLLLLPGPTLTVSDIRSFWESLTDAIVSLS